jgi:FkbM family methyltransferase
MVRMTSDPSMPTEVSTILLKFGTLRSIRLGALFAGLPAETFVAELYRGLLGRQPDPESQKKVERLILGQASAEDIVGEFLRSAEYCESQQRRAVTPSRLTNDQTQFGEFELLLKRWLPRAVEHPIVVDIGARGRERSNSYDLLRTFGWRGLLVEANPNLIPTIRSEFDGLNVEVVHCAISNYDGEGKLYLGTNEDVSSLIASASAGWGPIVGEVAVPVRRLGALLEERKIPRSFGLLSIDIEGEDVKVLNDVIQSGYRPQWIIIEASFNFSVKQLRDLPIIDAVDADYEIVGQTAANLVLERRS